VPRLTVDFAGLVRGPAGLHGMSARASAGSITLRGSACRGFDAKVGLGAAGSGRRVAILTWLAHVAELDLAPPRDRWKGTRAAFLLLPGVRTSPSTTT